MGIVNIALAFSNDIVCTDPCDHQIVLVLVIIVMIVATIELIQHNTELITTEMKEWEQYPRYLQTPSVTARRHVRTC